MTLEKLVFNFRYAIERAKKSGEDGDFFVRFPAGQCGVASDMLAQYLIENGYCHITYVCGTFYGNTPFESQSHAWLEIKNLIIDITGDQFKNHNVPLKRDIPVYIGPMSNYYRQFECLAGDVHEHFGLNKSWSNYYDLKKWYKTILKYIN